MMLEQEFVADSEQISSYADVTGDTNPIHLSTDYVDRDDTFSDENIVHGALIVGWISNLLNEVGTAFNGEVLLLNIDVDFESPLDVSEMAHVYISIDDDMTSDTEPFVCPVEVHVEKDDLTVVARGTATIKVDPTVPRTR